MTALATRRRGGRARGGVARGRAGADADGPPAPEPTLFDEPAVEPTLDELVTGAWDELTAQRPVACPMCGGEMRPGASAHARVTSARCGDCGTTFS